MKIKSLFLAILMGFIYIVATSFQSPGPLQGVWEYQGGKYNKQVVTAAKEFKLTKVYTASGYQVLATDHSGKIIKNEGGTFTVMNGILVETQTSGAATSSLKSKIMQYSFTIKNNKLTLKGRLTNKWPVEEYWKKVK